VDIFRSVFRLEVGAEVLSSAAGQEVSGGATAAAARGVEIDPKTQAFYCGTLRALNAAGAEYLVGGAYALARYTGIVRHTKDFDIFTRRRDRDRILEVLAARGYLTEVTFPHWLAKAYCPDGSGDFIDVIYSSGNGVATVDDEWFAHSVAGEVLGCAAPLCPAEEIIWSKSYVQERERFDGADIYHLLRVCAPALDWPRLLRRFGAHWRVLLAHLVNFGFVYPAERDRVPAWVMEELTARLQEETRRAPTRERLCRGTLVSREQYLIDIGDWGYADARLHESTMTPEEIRHWTDAIGKID
jgi:hypothetical protein